MDTKQENITCIFACKCIISLSAEVIAADTLSVTDSLVRTAHQCMVVYFHPTPNPQTQKEIQPQALKQTEMTFPDCPTGDTIITTVLAVEVLEQPLNTLVPP